MSPEQASGESELSPTSDICSLGCVVNEMLIGEPPFTGRSAQAVMARHVSELRVVRTELSPARGRLRAQGAVQESA
jgi:serine/threonine protein kinase